MAVAPCSRWIPSSRLRPSSCSPRRVRRAVRSSRWHLMAGSSRSPSIGIPPKGKDGKSDWHLATDVRGRPPCRCSSSTSALVTAGVDPDEKIRYHGGIRSVAESNLRDDKRDYDSQSLAYARRRPLEQRDQADKFSIPAAGATMRLDKRRARSPGLGRRHRPRCLRRCSPRRSPSSRCRTTRTSRSRRPPQASTARGCPCSAVRSWPRPSRMTANNPRHGSSNRSPAHRSLPVTPIARSRRTSRTRSAR